MAICCSVPLTNDTLKMVILATAASMTACKSSLWYWYNDERNAVHPDHISIKGLVYSVFDYDNATQSVDQVCFQFCSHPDTCFRLLPPHNLKSAVHLHLPSAKASRYGRESADAKCQSPTTGVLTFRCVLQAATFYTECPEDADCGIVLDLVVSSVLIYPWGPGSWNSQPASTPQLADTAQCAYTSSLFQV